MDLSWYKALGSLRCFTVTDSSTANIIDSTMRLHYICIWRMKINSITVEPFRSDLVLAFKGCNVGGGAPLGSTSLKGSLQVCSWILMSAWVTNGFKRSQSLWGRSFPEEKAKPFPVPPPAFPCIYWLDRSRDKARTRGACWPLVRNYTTSREAMPPKGAELPRIGSADSTDTSAFEAKVNSESAKHGPSLWSSAQTWIPVSDALCKSQLLAAGRGGCEVRLWPHQPSQESDL